MLPSMPKQATGPPDVAIWEMDRSPLVMGVKVLVKGMGWVNWAPAAPMKVTVMVLSRAVGAADVRVLLRRRVVRVVRMVEVYMFVVGGGVYVWVLEEGWLELSACGYWVYVFGMECWLMLDEE